LWESILPEQALRMPAELARVDDLLDDPRFFEPFRPFFSSVAGRPSTPIETYLRLMFLKYRYRLGFEALCRRRGPCDGDPDAAGRVRLRWRQPVCHRRRLR